MSACPFCHRRLLTQASACCNWCGREIPDANYQQQAEAKREAFFIEQALHDAASLARTESLYGDPLLTSLDPLTNLPLSLGTRRSARPAVANPGQAPSFGRPLTAGDQTPAILPQASTTPPEDEAGDRFRHLEL